MSKGISKVVERIVKDVCNGCERECELCKGGICEDIIIEIGCFFLYCAEREKEEE